MQFFYKLINGITLNIASMLIKNTTSYRSTISKKYNEWLNENIIYDTCEEILKNYLIENEITDLRNINMPYNW